MLNTRLGIHIVLVLVCWGLCQKAVAQENRRIGDWQSHLSHSRAFQSVEAGGVVYTTTQGGLAIYDVANGELRSLSTVQGMSGTEPTTIFAGTSRDRIYIGYEDGSIDYLRNERSPFRFYTDIKRNEFYPNKRINAFAGENDRLYVATAFGLVIYDVNIDLPITDISQFGNNPNLTPVTSVAVAQNRVWVSLDNGSLLSASVNNPNLKDPNAWQDETGSAGLPMGTNIEAVGAGEVGLYALLDTGVVQLVNGVWQKLPELDGNWDGMAVNDNAVSVWRPVSFKVRYPSGQIIDYFFQANPNYVLVSIGEILFVATQFRGILRWEDFQTRPITPPGPRNNECTRIAAGPGELYVAPVGYDQAFTPIPALGLNYFQPETGWQGLDSANNALPPQVTTGFARTYRDARTGEVFMGSWGTGLLRMKNGEVIDFYDCSNSGISVVFSCNPTALDEERVSGVGLDDRGILWVTGHLVQNPLVFRMPDGQWYQVPSNFFPSDHQITDLLVDDFGNKWMINQTQGLLVYNDQGTPTDFSDDRIVALRPGLNLGNLPATPVTALAKDDDGFIWVGTTQGVAVYFDPFSIGQGSVVDAALPVFDRTPLLRNSTVTSITVDGGNRKWMGTNDGVFLVSEDGDDVLLNFTIENSPLFSNQINDIDIDPQNGEVYIATSRGIIAYRGDATDGSGPCQDLFVFPNPVFTDYEGPVTIRGTVAGSKVKITTVSGYLVKEIEAQGGTAVWDGRDQRGRKVRSGIYLALSATDDGEEPCIGKFVVIAR